MVIHSVDLIVIKNNKILLGKVSEKWSGGGKYEWGLPGREIEPDDDMGESIKKNLKEETGMKFKSFKVFCMNENFGFGNHYVVTGVIVEAEGTPKITKPEDWIEWRFFDKNKIPKKLFPSAELSIKSYLKLC